MSSTLQRREQTQAPARTAFIVEEISRIPQSVRELVSEPKVFIRGDIRLQVTGSYAANKLVKGHYHIETEGMQEPLQVIWIIEGKVLNHTVRSLDIEFDVRGIPAGETLTKMLTVQVMETKGRKCIVNTSIFIQIRVVRDDVCTSDTAITAEPGKVEPCARLKKGV
jgi:hypothetical protein